MGGVFNIYEISEAESIPVVRQMAIFMQKNNYFYFRYHQQGSTWRMDCFLHQTACVNLGTV